MLSNIMLETPRLILREFAGNDWQAVHAYASDPEVVRFMQWGPNSIEETREFIANNLNWQRAGRRVYFDFAVVLKQNGQLIGSCGLHLARTISEGASQSATVKREKAAQSEAELLEPGINAAMGYCYARHHWGKGYATEAAQALLKFGFEHLRLHKMFSTCDAENLASAKVLEKIGMRREGHLLEDAKIKGRWRDSFVYAILEREWQDRR